MPLVIDFGRDFGRLDLAAAAPENVVVTYWDPNVFEMLVDRRLVLEHDLFVRSVDDAHDVDAAKLRAALAPVAMRHDVVTPDLTSGAFLHAFGDFPVK